MIRANDVQEFAERVEVDALAIELHAESYAAAHLAADAMVRAAAAAVQALACRTDCPDDLRPWLLAAGNTLGSGMTALAMQRSLNHALNSASKVQP